MAKTRYNAVVPIGMGNGETFWHRIGTAFENAKGITVYFNSLPLPDGDGKVKVMLFEAEDDRGSGRSGGSPGPGAQGGGGDMDDEVPF